MDKKAKKKIQVINKKLASLRQRLKGAKQQTDETDDVKKIESEITAFERELEELKNS